MRRLITVIVIAFCLGAVIGLGVLIATQPTGPRTETSGTALIGGPFTLTNQDGERVTEKDFEGKHSLVFFGFTHCPDICPAELQVIAEALDQLGDKADEVTPIFVTVDPARDTPQALKSYLSNFGDQFVGLTGSEEEIARIVGAEEREAEAAQKRFTEAADKAGVSHSWITGEGDASDVLLQAARLQDLVVVEQSTPGADLLWGPAVQMALSGYPTLVVPKGWTAPVARKHALVAWNSSVQAAAALRKAMPLLTETEEVTLLMGPSQETLPYTLRVPAPDPLAYLKRHGINAVTYDKEITGGDAGAKILKVASEKGADLLVMGAFGRSRFREWVLGGATRHIMANTEIPTLMAH